MLKKIRIYQVTYATKKKYEIENGEIFQLLRGYFNGSPIPFEYYTKMYECERDYKGSIMALLEDLFYEFNEDRPEDFKGHSLSVGDIIWVDGEIYKCASIGFNKLI